jgi:putative lipoic acid-binding regulatory protein
MKDVPTPPEAPRLAYPLRYTFKVMGLAADDFAAHARGLVERGAGAPAEEVTVRRSAGGKYHSASVVVRLDSEAQRRAVYLALRGDERVVYFL